MLHAKQKSNILNILEFNFLIDQEICIENGNWKQSHESCFSFKNVYNKECKKELEAVTKIIKAVLNLKIGIENSFIRMISKI